MLEIVVLGTAAGGGFPQWNCACRNCALARLGVLSPRLQSSVAVSGDGATWHLVNASPDVCRQVEMLPVDRSEEAPRFSPVHSVFLTNADLDHSLGLLLLREGDPLGVQATGAVRESVARQLALDRTLRFYNGLEWRDPPWEWRPVDASGLEVRAVRLRGTEPPRYDRQAVGGDHAVGYLFRDSSGAQAGIFPDVAVLDEELIEELAPCDRIWFDGTFWSEEEMLPLNGRTATEMGHVPVADSLSRLKALPAVVNFLHINNSNPILRADSAERRAVESVGLRVAEDGDRWQARP